MSEELSHKATDENVPMTLNASDRAKASSIPIVNAAAVMLAYPNDIVGSDVDLSALLGELRDSCTNVTEGDLSNLESMLAGQAQALQAIFTNLARRAQRQDHERRFEGLLTLALKAQAQCRATIEALIELQCPHHVAFVKQANISHGPQQVNNGEMHNVARARGKRKCVQNKLLEDTSNGISHLDTATAATTSRSDTAMEAVGKVNRAKKRER